MMNQTAERMRNVGLSMPSPSFLVDRFLDWVEQLGQAMMVPAQADHLSCREIRIKTHLDQFEA
jgi:hypothetical protein